MSLLVWNYCDIWRLWWSPPAILDGFYRLVLSGTLIRNRVANAERHEEVIRSTEWTRVPAPRQARSQVSATNYYPGRYAPACDYVWLDSYTGYLVYNSNARNHRFRPYEAVLGSFDHTRAQCQSATWETDRRHFPVAPLSSPYSAPIISGPNPSTYSEPSVSKPIPSSLTVSSLTIVATSAPPSPIVAASAPPSPIPARRDFYKSFSRLPYRY